MTAVRWPWQREDRVPTAVDDEHAAATRAAARAWEEAAAGLRAALLDVRDDVVVVEMREHDDE